MEEDGLSIKGLLKTLRPLQHAGSKEEAGEEPLSAGLVQPPFFDPAGTSPIPAAVLLRAARLEEAATEARELAQFEALFFRLASAAQARDSALFVAAAARLSCPELLEQLADRLPESGFNYDLLLRAICLALLGTETDDPLAPLNALCAAVKQLKVASDLSALFEKFSARRTDYQQAQRLLAVVPDLSLHRFTEDATYREHTVLGLAMSSEAHHFDLASELASRYGIDAWDLRAAHLEFLLTEAETEAAAQRVRQLRLRESLEREDAARFLLMMRTRIWPQLAGTDLPRLDLFLSLLPPDAEVGGEAAGEHAKVLRKLRAAAPAVNYKALSEGGDALRALSPHLNSGNVHVFAKLASHWGIKGSSVFSLWTGRLFWKEEGIGDFVHRFENCGPFFARLLPVDFVSFLREVVFSPASRDIELESRREILRRAAKLCRQQMAGQPKGGRKRKAADDEGEAFRWADAAQEVQAYLSHVDLVSDVLFPRLAELGVPEAELAPFQVLPPGAAFLEQVVTGLLLWGVPAGPLSELAVQLEVEQDAVAAAVAAAAQQLLVAGLSDLDSAREDLTALLARASQLSSPLDGRAAVLSAVKALLMEPDIRSRLGLFLVQLLRSYNDGSEDVAAAVVAQAICVLKEFFEEQEWDAQALSSDAAERAQLVKDLVAKSDSDEAMRAVHEALEILSHVSGEVDNTLWNCWVRRAPDFPELSDFIIDIFSRRCRPEFSEKTAQAVREAVTVYKTSDFRVAFVLCVLSGQEELVDQSEMKRLLTAEVCEKLAADQPLLRRVTEQGWLPRVVGTELYGKCVEYLIDSEDQKLVHDVVRGLNQKGFYLEASSLLADCQRLHTGLRSLGVLSSLWSKLPPR